MKIIEYVPRNCASSKWIKSILLKEGERYD